MTANHDRGPAGKRSAGGVPGPGNNRPGTGAKELAADNGAASRSRSRVEPQLTVTGAADIGVLSVGATGAVIVRQGPSP